MNKPAWWHRVRFVARLPALSLLLLFLPVAVAQEPATQQASLQSLLAQADDVLREMSQLTGLPIKGPLKKQVVNRSEVTKYLEENLHEEMTPAEIHAQEALVRALGLVPQDFSLERFLVAFYTEQAAGFYDYKRRTMFIADWVPPDMQAMTLAHELTHALQDQNFDLDRYMHARRDDDDATGARLAVIEGYATAAMFQHLAGGVDLAQLPSLSSLMQEMMPQQIEGAPEFNNAPYFFREQALFPYVQGVGFIEAGLQQGGWKNLDTLFQDAPETTRQIFDPQTYYHHQTPAKIELVHPPALEGMSSLHFLYQNSLGELGYYGLLGQLISEDEARNVGEEWLADKYVLYEQSGGNGYTLVARTRWTSADAAGAFFRDYHTILTHKYPQLSTDPRSAPDVFIGSAANGVSLLLREGDECSWAEGVPPAKADALLAWLRHQ